MITVDIVLIIIIALLLICLGIIMGILLAESVYDINCDTKFNKKETKILMKAYKKNRKVKVNKSKSLSKEEFIKSIDTSKPSDGVRKIPW